MPSVFDFFSFADLNSLFKTMADLFKTIEDRIALIIGYVKLNFTKYVHADISSIIFEMYDAKYTFLEELGIDYIGIEPALSKFVRYTLFYDDMWLKYRPKCILLYGPKGNNAFEIAAAFSRHMTVNDVLLKDIKHGINAYQTLSFSMFASDIKTWHHFDCNEKDLKICIFTNVEECKGNSDYSDFVHMAINTFIKPKNSYNHLDKTLFIFIANGINNLDELPPFEWQCPIKIGLSSANKQKMIHQNMESAMKKILDIDNAPIGLSASLIAETNHEIYHYSDHVTDVIKLGKLIGGKMEKIRNVSLLIRGNSQCGKTMIAEHIALQCHFPFMIKVCFIDTGFSFTFDEDKVIKYLCDIFEIASQTNGFCVIVIDDLHNLFNNEWYKCEEKLMDMINAGDQTKRSNAIWNALLALMNKKHHNNAKLFVIVTCKYNVDCQTNNVLRYFDFVKRIPSGLMRSAEGLKIVLKNNGFDKMCKPDLNEVIESVQDILDYNQKFNVKSFLEHCAESKKRYGFVDALWLHTKNLPFFIEFRVMNEYSQYDLK